MLYGYTLMTRSQLHADRSAAGINFMLNMFNTGVLLPR